MLNIKLAQIHDMLVFRGYNAFMSPKKDTIIVAPHKNACYVVVSTMNSNDSVYYTLNLIQCATGSTLKTDYLSSQTAVISMINKMLNYSSLILECRENNLHNLTSEYYLYLSLVGDNNEILLSLMFDDNGTEYPVKVMPCSLEDGIYNTGYCKTDFESYDSELELITEFVKGVR